MQTMLIPFLIPIKFLEIIRVTTQIQTQNIKKDQDKNWQKIKTSLRQPDVVIHPNPLSGMANVSCRHYFQ